MRKSRSLFVVPFIALAFMAAPLSPVSASDPPPPPPPPSAYDCPADADAAIQVELGPDWTTQTVAEFTGKWVPRLTGVAPIVGGLSGAIAGITDLDDDLSSVNVDEFINRTALPAAIANERYHSLSLSLKQCLVKRLYDALAADDPNFPNPAFNDGVATFDDPGTAGTVPPGTAETPIMHDVMALLYLFVFDNQAILDLKSAASNPDPAPPVETPAVDPDTALHTLLNNLKAPGVPPLPSVAIPPDLAGLPFVTKSAEDLLAGLVNPVNTLFTDLGSVIQSLTTDVKVPPINLPAVDIGGIINTLRRVVDSASYSVCWRSTKIVTRQCTPVDVPLGTVVPIDLAGDSRFDVVAQLRPEPNAADALNSAAMRWTVTRLPNVATGYSGRLQAHVFSFFRTPVTDILFSVGSNGFQSTLAEESNYLFTLADAQKANAGEVLVDVDISHTKPGTRSAVTYGVAPIERDPDNLGAGSVETWDTGALELSPVPATPSSIKAHLTVKAGDFDGDNHSDDHLGVKVTLPQTGVLLKAFLFSKLPVADAAQGQQQAECCPFRDIRAVVDAIPTEVDIVVKSFPAKRITDATYTSNAPITQVDFSSTLFADTDESYPQGIDGNTFKKVTALIKEFPSFAHVKFTAPDPDSHAKTTDVHYDANTAIPHVEFTSQEAVHDPVSGSAVEQRRLKFTADTIPTEIDLKNTTTQVTERNSTGKISYAANGSVTNAHVEVADNIGVSELVADIKSIPKSIFATYDLEKPADLDPNKPGCEDIGHTIVHVDGRTASGAPAGSAAFGELTAKYRFGVNGFLTPDAAIADLEHAIISLDPRSALTCLDDTMQADLRYGGLRYLDAELLESGRIFAKIRNDADKLFVMQVARPDQTMTTRIDKLPKQITFSKEPAALNPHVDHNTISYNGCTPAGLLCIPKLIDKLQVRIDGKGTTDEDAFRIGEFVDVTASGVPHDVKVDLDLPEADGSKKQVSYDASTETTEVTAAVVKKVADMGDLSIGARLEGIPTHFDLSFGKDQPTEFNAGAGETIDKISAHITNSGSAQEPASLVFAPHAYAKYHEAFNAKPTLEAHLGLAHLQSFKMDSGGGGGSFEGTIKTNPPATNLNSKFDLVADVLTLGKLKDSNCQPKMAGDPPEPVADPDLNNAQVIRTGSEAATLKPLPNIIRIEKSGGKTVTSCADPGTDTSLLSIDTTGSSQPFAINADLGIGSPDAVTEALAEPRLTPKGVTVGDGSAPGEEDAIRLGLNIPVTPVKSVVRYGQILKKGPVPDPNAALGDPAFDISGFGALGTLDIVVGLDDTPLGDRLQVIIGVGGISPALGFLQFFPIQLREDNPNSATDDGLGVRVDYKAGNIAGPLDLDLRLGEKASPARIDTRIVAHTDSLPQQVKFVGKTGAALPGTEEERDKVQFLLEFLDTAGARSASPGKASVKLYTPGRDGVIDPPAKLALDLNDVPSFVDFRVKKPASVKTGNPDERCGKRDSTFVLPSIEYDSDGSNKNLLDLKGEIDTKLFTPEGEAVNPNDPKVFFDVVDMADGLKISQEGEEGKIYRILSPGAATGKVLVKVDPLDVTLLDLDWTGCTEPTGLIGWNSSGRAQVGLFTKLRLEITGLNNIDLEPGFSTGVTGSFTKAAMALPDPQLGVRITSNGPTDPQPNAGFKSGLHIRMSSKVKGTIPVIAAPNGLHTFALPIVFHVAKQSSGPWLSFMTPIPCVIPGYQLTVFANIKPHRTKLQLNQFDVPGGTWTVTADPLGISAGASGINQFFFGLDLIDTIAGLFTSPYDKGMQAPSLGCKWVF